MAKQKITNSQLNLTQGTGYTYIGAVLIQWGSVTSGTVAAGALSEVSVSTTFPVSFSTNPSITAMPSDFGNVCGEYVSVGSVSTSGVTFWVGHTGASVAATNVIRWIAIGAA